MYFSFRTITRDVVFCLDLNFWTPRHILKNSNTSLGLWITFSKCFIFSKFRAVSLFFSNFYLCIWYFIFFTISCYYIIVLSITSRHLFFEFRYKNLHFTSFLFIFTLLNTDTFLWTMVLRHLFLYTICWFEILFCSSNFNTQMLVLVQIH